MVETFALRAGCRLVFTAPIMVDINVGGAGGVPFVLLS